MEKEREKEKDNKGKDGESPLGAEAARALRVALAPERKQTSKQTVRVVTDSEKN